MKANILYVLTSALLVTAVYACKKKDVVLSSDKEIISFSFKKVNNPGLSDDVIGVVSSDNTISLKVIENTLLKNLVPTIVYKGKSVSPDTNTSHDFSVPVTCTVTAEDNSVATYSIKIENPFNIQFGSDQVDWGTSIITDISGNVYVSGFTGGLLGAAQIGSADFMVIKYDSKGNRQWVSQFGTPGYEGLRTLCVDKSGNIYVAGTTDETYATTKGDGYFAKLDNMGNVIWSKFLRTPVNDDISGILCDQQGNIILVGNTDGSLFSQNAGGTDIFLAKYDTNGNLIWAKQTGSTGKDRSTDICFTLAGTILVSGYTEGSFSGPNKGATDMFMSEYNTNGTELWIKQLGSAFSEYAMTIAIDGQDNIILGGRIFDNNSTDQVFLNKYDKIGSLVWTKESNQFKEEHIRDIAVDKSGNIAAIGNSEDFTGPPYADGFFYKFDAAGNQLFFEKFGAPAQPDRFGAITITAAGTALVTGSSGGSLFGPNNGYGDLIIKAY